MVFLMDFASIVLLELSSLTSAKDLERDLLTEVQKVLTLCPVWSRMLWGVDLMEAMAMALLVEEQEKKVEMVQELTGLDC